MPWSGSPASSTPRSSGDCSPRPTGRGLTLRPPARAAAASRRRTRPRRPGGPRRPPARPGRPEGTRRAHRCRPANLRTRPAPPRPRRAFRGGRKLPNPALEAPGGLRAGPATGRAAGGSQPHGRAFWSWSGSPASWYQRVSQTKVCDTGADRGAPSSSFRSRCVRSRRRSPCPPSGRRASSSSAMRAAAICFGVLRSPGAGGVNVLVRSASRPPPSGGRPARRCGRWRPPRFRTAWRPRGARPQRAAHRRRRRRDRGARAARTSSSTATVAPPRARRRPPRPRRVFRTRRARGTPRAATTGRTHDCPLIPTQTSPPPPR